MERQNNTDVLERVGEGRIMLELIKKRKRNWLGHWLRRNCLLNNAVEGMVNGKKIRGRRRYRMIENIMINGLCFPHATLSLPSEQTLNDLKRSQGHWLGGEESGFG